MVLQGKVVVASLGCGFATNHILLDHCYNSSTETTPKTCPSKHVYID